jgi:acyl-homoserine-lactone acylase
MRRYRSHLLPMAMVLAIVFTGCASTGPEPLRESSAVFAIGSEQSAEWDVIIRRDTWGVPHVYGKTDADTAYGLAYAHCEDDFRTIEDAFITGRAMGGAVHGADAAPIDYVVHLLGVWDHVNLKYESDLSEDTRRLVEAYAVGVNDYFERHRDESFMPDLYPVTGKDVVAGFVLKSPFFFGLDNDIMELFGDTRRREVSTKTAAADFDIVEAMRLAGAYFSRGLERGSNTFSVAPNRSADGGTYLNVNSHQPFTGPVAWYEAHLKSDEGWDMVGGLFPGMPVIGHGHNRNLGWAMTVNGPDLVDTYVLTMNPDDPNQYRFDGDWKDLDVSEVTLRVRVNPDSPMTMSVRREVLRSIHGPAVRTPHGVYAIRYAGMGDIRQVEQWYRMNKAQNRDDWYSAMAMQAIASLNVGYADREGNIAYIYNAKLPLRAQGWNWRQYLPGDTSETLWTEFLPFDRLPMVVNPESGFVQNCNSTPFQTTDGPGNPEPADFSAEFGIETHMTNRALRAMELFGADDSVTFEEFERYKYDLYYSEQSFIGKLLRFLQEQRATGDPIVEEARALLANWDRSTHEDSRAAALAIMTGLPLFNNWGRMPEPERAFDLLKSAAEKLRRKHGRIDVPWSEINRIVRGNVDIGLGGGPDILHAVYGGFDEEKVQYIARAGDTLVQLVRWDEQGAVSSKIVHQFGSATSHPDSKHYADQVPLYVQRTLRDVWFTDEDIAANLAREYRPGQ